MTVDPVMRNGAPRPEGRRLGPAERQGPAALPRYVRGVEDFGPGQAWAHMGSRPIDASSAAAFAAACGEANPLYHSRAFARAHGFQDQVVPPLLLVSMALDSMVWPAAVSGYRDLRFPRPVYPGDLVSTFSAVSAVRPLADGTGLVGLVTWAENQHGQVVLRFERDLHVPAGRTGLPADRQLTPPSADLLLGLPLPLAPWPQGQTRPQSYWEAFRPGEVRLHGGRRWSASAGPDGAGDPAASADGRVLAWLAGLTSVELSENSFWDLGYAQAWVRQAPTPGDNLHAVSRIVAVEPTGGPWTPKAGRITVQVVALLNQSAEEAWRQYGEALFALALGGRPVNPSQVAVVTRQLLVKKLAGCV